MVIVPPRMVIKFTLRGADWCLIKVTALFFLMWP